MTLSPPWATILPGAVATMSIWPKHAQASAALKIRMTTRPSARPTGDGGVSTISSAAGRNSVSTRSRPRGGRKPSNDAKIRQLEVSGLTSRLNKLRRGGRLAASADFMETRLQAVQGGVVAAAAEKIF